MYNELIGDLIEALRPIEVTGDAATSMCLAMELSEAKAEIEQLKRERDAAISDLKSICDDTGDGCDLCKHLPCVKDGVGHCIGWQWRGLEEGAEDG